MSENPSVPETVKHIERVQYYLFKIVSNLMGRAYVHDDSKLKSPEVEGFDQVTGLLKNTTYDSDEYKRILKEVLGPALEHHYGVNDHHPEHFESPEHRVHPWRIGIRRMNLLQQLEMLADWKAAGERHANGSMIKSLWANKGRFQIPPEMFWQLAATCHMLGWISTAELASVDGFYPIPTNENRQEKQEGA